MPPFLSQQRLPFSLGSPQRKVSKAGNIFREIRKIGDIATNRAIRLKAEHDTARAQSALLDLRGVSRAKFSEMNTRQGADAVGIVEEYVNFYDKAVAGFDEGFDNDVQRKIFKAKAEAWRITDTFTLEGKRITEHYVHMADTLDGVRSNGINEVTLNPLDDAVYDNAVAGLIEWYPKAFPGQGNVAQFNLDIMKLQSARLLGMKDEQPEIAKVYLERWKGSLGTAYPGIKTKIEGASFLRQAQFESERILKSGFERRDQFLELDKIQNPEVKKLSRQIVRAGHNDQDDFKKQEQQDLKDSGYDAVTEAANYTEALARAYKFDGPLRAELISLAKSTFALTPKEKEKLKNEQTIKHTDNLRTLDSGEDISITELKDQLRKGEINADQYKLTLESTDPQKSIPYITGNKRLDFARTQKLFNPGDKPEDADDNNRQWASYKKIYNDFVKGNPQATAEDHEKFIDEMMEPVKVGFWEDVFEFGLTTEEFLEKRQLEKREKVQGLINSPKIPTQDEFLAKSKELNPKFSDDEIIAIYNKKYLNK